MPVGNGEGGTCTVKTLKRTRRDEMPEGRATVLLKESQRCSGAAEGGWGPLVVRSSKTQAKTSPRENGDVRYKVRISYVACLRTYDGTTKMCLAAVRDSPVTQSALQGCRHMDREDRDRGMRIDRGGHRLQSARYLGTT